MRIIEFTEEHLKKFPALAQYVAERDGLKVVGYVDEGQCVGAIVYNGARVEYVHVATDMRRSGYGETLLQHAIDKHTHDHLRASVETDNLPALQLFLKSGFKIVGFGHGWGDRRYVLEYHSGRLKPSPPMNQPMREAVAQLVDTVYAVEVLPVRVGQANKPR
jgi:L-amino acid N-acyltransferase YncA